MWKNIKRFTEDEAVFCPSCGTKAEETDSIGVWRSLDEQKNGKHVNPITDNEVVQNLMKKIPDNAKNQMKELSGKAKEGVSQLAEKVRDYGGRLTEKAEDFTQNVSQTVRDIPRPDISGQFLSVARFKWLRNNRAIIQNEDCLNIGIIFEQGGGFFIAEDEA